MSYREDLIERLRSDGLWEHLTGEQQQRFEGMSDDQARRMMILEDEWDMGDENAVEMFGLMSLVRMMQSFQGTLIEHGGEGIGRLSKPGRLLAEFFIALLEKDLSSDDIEAGLQELSPLVIAALVTVYRRTPGEEEE